MAQRYGIPTASTAVPFGSATANSEGVEKCRTPHLYEDDIKAMFLKAVSELMIDREALIDDGRVLHTAFTDFNAIDKEVAEITSEIDVLSGLVQKLVDENASTTLDQTEYRSRYDGYIDRYDKAKKRLAALQEQRQLPGAQGRYSERIPL